MVGEISAGLVRDAPTLVEGIGNAIIRSKLVPEWFRRFGIEQAGTAQKPLLIFGIVVVTLLFGIGLGILTGWLGAEKRRGKKTISPLMPFLAPALVFGFFGIIGGLTLSDSHGSSITHATLTSIFAAGLGYGVLVVLIRIGEHRFIPFDKRDLGDPKSSSRRNFLVGAGSTAIISGFGSLVGRELVKYQRSLVNQEEVRSLLGAARTESTAPNLSSAANFDNINGIAPIITPTEDFYLIDTAIIPPNVNHTTWELKVIGMVENELSLSFNEILDMGLVEENVTLSCVSNEIGGNLIGNAVWRGVPLRRILDEAGVDRNRADQVVGRSIDDWTSGFPTQLAYEDDRPCLVAVEMNGEPLTKSHGFPARLVVAGLYGYVSATKWLTEIELTTWDSFDSYWVPRGWSKEGPIKTQSRIDVPRRNQNLSAGQISIAGVAWAPNRGVSKVEVRTALVSDGIDGARWSEAQLSSDVTDNSWRQWHYVWDAQPGRYQIQVRATDGSGDTQTPVITRPDPNGASGWHSVIVRVS